MLRRTHRLGANPISRLLEVGRGGISAHGIPQRRQEIIECCPCAEIQVDPINAQNLAYLVIDALDFAVRLVLRYGFRFRSAQHDWFSLPHAPFATRRDMQFVPGWSARFPVRPVFAGASNTAGRAGGI
ncbi:MAG: hypothetical protein ACT4PS_16350 [Betaproteobacteria bacterium]